MRREKYRKQTCKVSSLPDKSRPIDQTAPEWENRIRVFEKFYEEQQCKPAKERLGISDLRLRQSEKD
jgi:hypothetical protein